MYIVGSLNPPLIKSGLTLGASSGAPGEEIVFSTLKSISPTDKAVLNIQDFHTTRGVTS